MYKLFVRNYDKFEVIVEFGFDENAPHNFNVWVECDATDFGIVGDNIADLVIQTQNHYNEIFSQMNKGLNMTYANLGLKSNDFNGFQFGRYTKPNSKNDMAGYYRTPQNTVYQMWSTVNDNIVNESNVDKFMSKLEWNNFVMVEPI
jgi:hypothetical protein